jgi:hypothetical protein
VRGDPDVARALPAPGADRRDRGRCARRHGGRRQAAVGPDRRQRNPAGPSGRVLPEIRAEQTPADLAERRHRDDLQRDRARAIARSAARRGMVRRTGEVALRHRLLGPAHVRAAHRIEPTRRHHHDAQADQAAQGDHFRPRHGDHARLDLREREQPRAALHQDRGAQVPGHAARAAGARSRGPRRRAGRLVVARRGSKTCASRRTRCRR